MRTDALHVMVYHPAIARTALGITGAVMLSRLLWLLDSRDGQPVDVTADEWQRTTGLSRREQETARGRLRDAGFWRETRQGRPARLFFDLDRDALDAWLQASVAGFSFHKSAKQVFTNPPNKIAQIRHTIPINVNSIERVINNSLTREGVQTAGPNYDMDSFDEQPLPRPDTARAVRQQDAQRAQLLAAWWQARYGDDTQPTTAAARSMRGTLNDLLTDGVQPEQLAAATRAAVERWPEPQYATLAAVARALPDLLQPAAPRRAALSPGQQRAADAAALSRERLLRQVGATSRRNGQQALQDDPGQIEGHTQRPDPFA